MNDRDMHLGSAVEDIYIIIDKYQLSDIEIVGLLDIIKHDVMADSREKLLEDHDDINDIEIGGLAGDN